ncbi:hypothetical protein Tco_0454998 [Tanacetum coccineum]
MAFNLISRQPPFNTTPKCFDVTNLVTRLHPLKTPGRARPPAPYRRAPVTDQPENKDPPSSASTSPSSSSSDSPLIKETLQRQSSDERLSILSIDESELVGFRCGMSFGVATLRAVVHAGDKTSGDARSWYMISGDTKSWVNGWFWRLKMCTLGDLGFETEGALQNLEVTPMVYHPPFLRERFGLGTTKHTRPESQASSSKVESRLVIIQSTELSTSSVSTEVKTNDHDTKLNKLTKLVQMLNEQLNSSKKP